MSVKIPMCHAGKTLILGQHHLLMCWGADNTLATWSSLEFDGSRMCLQKARAQVGQSTWCGLLGQWACPSSEPPSPSLSLSCLGVSGAEGGRCPIKHLDPLRCPHHQICEGGGICLDLSAHPQPWSWYHSVQSSLLSTRKVPPPSPYPPIPRKWRADAHWAAPIRC